MQIQFSKPPALNYQAGQYVFLKSAAVSKYEWHPFTLTSSPDDDFLECHIKAVGDWTSTCFATIHLVFLDTRKCTCMVYTIRLFMFKILSRNREVDAHPRTNITDRKTRWQQ
eukprot:Tamp_19432.p2 GENE.Tamp_19432~~Tamp_19432.p2  ORF type:complete len:112 (-),score=4.94 Tamp_19432:226-561(-)